MSKPRRAPNKTERLAAVLLMLKRGGDWLVPEPVRSNGDAKSICAAVVWNHDVQFAIRPHNDPRLLTPMRKTDHDARFARDVGEIARVRRGAKKRAGANRKSRPMQYTSWKDSHKRTFAGKAVLR
jgi:hypothetical protein